MYIYYVYTYPASVLFITTISTTKPLREPLCSPRSPVCAKALREAVVHQAEDRRSGGRRLQTQWACREAREEPLGPLGSGIAWERKWWNFLKIRKWWVFYFWTTKSGGSWIKLREHELFMIV